MDELYCSHFLSADSICGVLAGAFSSAAQAQTATSSPPKSITLELGNGAQMDFVLIPAGTFMMGAEDSKADEKPATKVTITQPFYLGKYDLGSRFRNGFNRNAVAANVAWGRRTGMATTPLRLEMFVGRCPRVARSAQPWALEHSPVGAGVRA